MICLSVFHLGDLYIFEPEPDSPVIDTTGIDLSDTMTCVSQVGESEHPMRLATSYGKYWLLKTNSNETLHRWSVGN